MSVNSVLIDEINEFRDKVIENSSDRNIVNFKLNNVDVDEENRLLINNCEVTRRVLNKILSFLRIKNQFLKYKKELDKGDWKIIRDILLQANQKMEFYGVKVNQNEKEIIWDLFKKNIDIRDSSDLDINKYFDSLISSLYQTDIEFVKKNFEFDNDKNEVIIELLEKNISVDIFENNKDIWKPGIHLNWSMLNLGVMPFFERLMCSNGMIVNEYGFKTNIQRKNFNTDKIEREIISTILNTHEKHGELIKENCNHLNKSNLSVREFLEFKKFISKRNESKEYNMILGNVFNEEEIYKNYGTDLKEKSDKWLSTANSGRNAFDFLNDLTYLNSHDFINKDHKADLGVQISNLFFKKAFDLEDVAEFKDFRVQKVY